MGNVAGTVTGGQVIGAGVVVATGGHVGAAVVVVVGHGGGLVGGLQLLNGTQAPPLRTNPGRQMHAGR